jgi:NADH-quinone oxidoreductase subunit G/NADP-reducing hydrogenase subunit HndD
VKARMTALYQIDREDTLRVSHRNSQVQRLYTEFLGEPLGHKSHELLHTKYQQREVMR